MTGGKRKKASIFRVSLLDNLVCLRSRLYNLYAPHTTSTCSVSRPHCYYLSYKLQFYRTTLTLCPVSISLVSILYNSLSILRCFSRPPTTTAPALILDSSTTCLVLIFFFVFVRYILSLKTYHLPLIKDTFHYYRGSRVELKSK